MEPHEHPVSALPAVSFEDIDPSKVVMWATTILLTVTTAIIILRFVQHSQDRTVVNARTRKMYEAWERPSTPKPQFGTPTAGETTG